MPEDLKSIIQDIEQTISKIPKPDDAEEESKATRGSIKENMTNLITQMVQSAEQPLKVKKNLQNIETAIKTGIEDIKSSITGFKLPDIFKVNVENEVSISNLKDIPQPVVRVPNTVKIEKPSWIGEGIVQSVHVLTDPISRSIDKIVKRLENIEWPTKSDKPLSVRLSDGENFYRAVDFIPLGGGGGGSSSSGSGDGTIIDGVSSSIKATVKDYTNSNPLTVVTVDTNGDYVAAGAGTQYTEDAPAAANPVGGAINLVRDDSRSGSLTSTDGDNVALRGNNKGEAYVKITDSDALLTTIDTDTGNIATSVQLIDDAIYTEGGAFTTDTSKGQVIMGQDTDGGARALRVSDSGEAFVSGLIAHDASDSSTKPIKIGGYAKAAAPTNVSADGDRVNAWFLRNGAQATVLTAAGALIGGDATNGLDVDVTASVLPTGAATSAKQDTGNTSVGNIDTTLGAKTDAKSTATDTTSVSAISVLKQISASVQAPPSQAVTNAGTFVTQDNGALLTSSQLIDDVIIAHDADTSSSKLSIIGGEYHSSPPKVSASTDGVRLRLTQDGRPLSLTESTDSFNLNNNYSSAQTNTSIQTAPGANKRLVVTKIVYSRDTAGNMKLVEDPAGTPATKFGPHYFPANGGMVAIDTYIPLTANKALGITTVGGGNETFTCYGITENV